ncbi:MAG TPA: radical SAM protein [Bryobacteraceae bacterium]|nr:radical SAM protein [Bryobacteraceae bacterium]
MLKPVILTHANHVRSDAKQTARMQPYPPLQTLLAAGMLRSNGIPVRFFDPALEDTLADLHRKFEKMLQRERPRLVVVCDDDFNFLTKMCLLHNRELSLWFAERARAAGVPAIVHGSDSADHALLYLEAGFSAVIRGEVEDALLDYVQGRAPEAIPGVICRSANGSVHFGPPRIPRSDLDSLPLPAWDLVDINRYREAWMEAHGYFSLNMASSRGCPFRCNWCAKPIYGNSYHARSPRAVAAEMALLHDTYKPDHIWFADDIFALSGRWTAEFAGEVCRLGASIPFKMQSRCDLMTPEAAAALNRAGCAEVWMGAESGSQKILDAMEKGITVADIYNARENLRREGIRACFFLQFGYPGEEWEEIEETIRMVRETAPDDVGISVSYPLPNTRFHEIVAAQLGSRANWKDSGDLRMMYRGSWSTEFYRELANAIHAEVRGESRPRWDKVYALRDSARLAEVA